MYCIALHCVALHCIALHYPPTDRMKAQRMSSRASAFASLQHDASALALDLKDKQVGAWVLCMQACSRSASSAGYTRADGEAREWQLCTMRRHRGFGSLLTNAVPGVLHIIQCCTLSLWLLPCHVALFPIIAQI